MLNSEFILNFKRFKVADLTNILYEKKCLRMWTIFQVEEDGSVSKIRHGEIFEDHMRFFEGL